MNELLLILAIIERLSRIGAAFQKGDDVSPEDLAFVHKLAEAAEDDALNTP